MNRRETRRELKARLAAAEAEAGLGETTPSFCVSCGSPMRVSYNRAGCKVACSNDECPNSRHPYRERYVPRIATVR